jgi:hypothetical protein
MRYTCTNILKNFRNLNGLFDARFVVLQCAILFWAILPCARSQEIPVGFHAERYASLWERNPFGPASSAVPEVRPSAFEKLYLTSWLIDGGKEVICVENSETKEVQRIGSEPNQKNSMRLIAMHPNLNPRLVEAVISDNKEQGTVKFRYEERPSPEPATSTVTQFPAQADAQMVSHRSGNLPDIPASKHASKLYPGLPRVRSEGGSRPRSRVPGSGPKDNLPDPVTAQSGSQQN